MIHNNKEMINILNKLKSKFNIIGIKSSFEDEGVYYNELIKRINNKFNNEFKIVLAPGPSEIDEAKHFNVQSILDGNKILDISQLTSLIKDSSFVIANDTGPAHIAAHLNVKGLTLFGKHTTAFKVSIERENFKAIQVDDLSKLSAEKVFDRLSKSILIKALN